MAFSLCSLYFLGRSTAVPVVVVLDFLIAGSAAAKVCLNKIHSSSSPPDLVPASSPTPRLHHHQDPFFLALPPPLIHFAPHSSTLSSLQICSTLFHSAPPSLLICYIMLLSDPSPPQISFTPPFSAPQPLQIFSAPSACSHQ
jgi:hypothetical protein